MRPTIIDCDPGIDDAIAILLAFGSPELDVRAITTVAGNLTAETTAANAHRLLQLLGRTDVPVGAGAVRPLVRPPADPVYDAHGRDGLGDVGIAPAAPGAASRAAVDLIVEVVESSAEPVTLVALAPLTNIALLDALRPDIVRRLDRIVVMGGAMRGGNVTPTAEFNVWFDPHAAQRVFSLDVDITVVGLDVTEKSITPLAAWSQLGDGDRSSRIREMNRFYSTFYEPVDGAPVTAQHDSLAVAVAVRPDLVTTSAATIDVECESPLTVGTTVVDRSGPPHGRARIAVDVRVEEFNAFLVDRIGGLLSRLDAAGAESDRIGIGAD